MIQKELSQEWSQDVFFLLGGTIKSISPPLQNLKFEH